MNVGRDLKRGDGGDDQKTKSTKFAKAEALVAAGDFADTQINEKLDRKETEQEKDDQRNNAPEEAAKKDETRKEKRKLPCAFCDYKTGKSSHMQRHVKGVHKFLELIKSEQTAEVDEKTISKEESFPAVTLSEEVALEESYGATANESSMKRESKCGDCNLRFSGQKHLRRHFLSLHTDKRYLCEKCNFTTNRKDTLKTHRNTRGHKMQVYLHDESLLI